MHWTSAQDQQLESGLSQLYFAVLRGTSWDGLGQASQTDKADPKTQTSQKIQVAGQAVAHAAPTLPVLSPFPLQLGELAQRLAAYGKILLEWQEAFHLLGEPKDFVNLHLLDSVSGAFFLLHLFSLPSRQAVCAQPVQSQVQIVDVGSGLGLPGIPLALCLLPNRAQACAQNGEMQFYLVEPGRRRANILRSILRELDLQSFVTVCEYPVENWAKWQNPETFETKADAEKFPTKNVRRIVTCRAFRPLDKKSLKQLQAPLVGLEKQNANDAGQDTRSGGILLYKSDPTKARKELQALHLQDHHPCERWLSSTFQLPHCGHQRSLFYSDWPSVL